MTSTLNDLVHPLVSAIGWALVHFLWQGTLIAVISAGVLLFLRNAKAQTRYAIACVALLFCFLIPMWQVMQALQMNYQGADTVISLSKYSMTAPDSSELHSIATWLQHNMNHIVLLWALVVSLLSIRLSLGLWWLRGYHQGQRGVANAYWQQQVDRLAQGFALSTRIMVRVVQDLESPVTIGWLRPMILIPASLITGMMPAHLEALLAHELAHIRRYDYLVNFAQNVIEMILFFHPAVWWISKKIRNERENIADDLAASMLGEPRRLALALQELELIQFTTPQLAQAAHGGNLMSRIKRLIRPEVQGINWKTAVTAVGIATVCVGFAANAALPTLTRDKQANTLNHVVALLEESDHDADLNKSEIAETLSSDQTSHSAIDTNVSKNARNSKDVIVIARINFNKKGCTPEYPRQALSSEMQGVSSLNVHFSANGRIDAVDIYKSSGHELLDDAVKNQLLSGKCTAKPGTVNGKPQPTTTRVEYVWKLD